MASFDFYLNRSGVRGPQGIQGEQGFSPIITVATNTLSEYILQIQTRNNTFQTVNLREHKDDLGGTYIRYNRDTGVMYAGDADVASQSQMGVVRFAAATDIEREASDCVVTPADVVDMIDDAIAGKNYDSQIDALDARITTNTQNISTNASNITANTNAITALQSQMTGLLANYVTTNTTQTITGRKTFDLLRTDRIQTSGGTTYLRTNNTVTGTDLTIGNSSIFGDIEISTPEEILLSSPDIKTYRNGNLYDNIDTGNISNYVPDMNNYYNTTQIDLMLSEKADISDIPTVGNGTITFTQDGVTKGTITTNQSGDTTIALDAGGTTYSAGTGIDITNDEISIDTNIVATQSDIPTNYVTTDTLQTIGGFKTFSNYVTVNGYVVAQSFKSSLNAEQFSLAYQGSDALSSGYIVFANKNSSVRKVILGNQNDFDNIQDNSVNGIIDKNGNAYLTSSNISTNAYIQALEGRITALETKITALETNINGGNANA